MQVVMLLCECLVLAFVVGVYAASINQEDLYE